MQLEVTLKRSKRNCPGSLLRVSCVATDGDGVGDGDADGQAQVVMLPVSLDHDRVERVGGQEDERRERVYYSLKVSPAEQDRTGQDTIEYGRGQFCRQHSTQHNNPHACNERCFYLLLLV